MHTHLEIELRNVKSRLLEMADLSIEAIQHSIQSIRDQNVMLADAVIANDQRIDQLELIIDDECIRLLATRQPAAGELRLVLSIMKINTDLERIADLAVSICKQYKRMAGQPLIKPLIDIPRMAEICVNMLRDCISAINEKDAALARDIIDRDDFIDKLNVQMYRELFTFMAEEPRVISQAIALLMISKSLERIGDHVTNIAERIVYYIQGDDIRHKDVPRQE